MEWIGTEISKVGLHLKLSTWKQFAKEGIFKDNEGYGHFATKTQESNITVFTHHVTGKSNLYDYKTNTFTEVKAPTVAMPKEFTHIVWYNVRKINDKEV